MFPQHQISQTMVLLFVRRPASALLVHNDDVINQPTLAAGCRRWRSLAGWLTGWVPEEVSLFAVGIYFDPVVCYHNGRYRTNESIRFQLGRWCWIPVLGGWWGSWLNSNRSIIDARQAVSSSMSGAALNNELRWGDWISLGWPDWEIWSWKKIWEVIGKRSHHLMCYRVGANLSPLRMETWGRCSFTFLFDSDELGAKWSEETSQILVTGQIWSWDGMAENGK